MKSEELDLEWRDCASAPDVFAVESIEHTICGLAEDADGELRRIVWVTLRGGPMHATTGLQPEPSRDLRIVMTEEAATALRFLLNHSGHWEEVSSWH